MVLVIKNLPTNAGDVRDMDLIPGSGRSSGGGHGNPLQFMPNTIASTMCLVFKSYYYLVWEYLPYFLN